MNTIPETIFLDEKILNQIILNLMNNAIKFTEKGSIDIILSTLPENKFEIQVKDTGIGIPERFKDEIFQRFTQIENPYTKKYEGTGLGLSIIKELLDILGGSISLESTVGLGSTFTIILPFELHKVENEKTADFPKTFLKDKKILMVEDNEINSFYLETLLKKNEAKVTKAENGSIALDLLKLDTFDIVLMDMQMPIMNGFECTTIIRNQDSYSDLPIIALTGYSMPEDTQKMFESGVNDILIKPINEKDLLLTLYKFL